MLKLLCNDFIATIFPNITFIPTEQYISGECYAWFHLYGLCWAVRNTEHGKITKWKINANSRIQTNNVGLSSHKNHICQTWMFFQQKLKKYGRSLNLSVRQTDESNLPTLILSYLLQISRKLGNRVHQRQGVSRERFLPRLFGKRSLPSLSLIIRYLVF